MNPTSVKALSVKHFKRSLQLFTSCSSVTCHGIEFFAIKISKLIQLYHEGKMYACVTTHKFLDRICVFCLLEMKRVRIPWE